MRGWAIWRRLDRHSRGLSRSTSRMCLRSSASLSSIRTAATRRKVCPIPFQGSRKYSKENAKTNEKLQTESGLQTRARKSRGTYPPCQSFLLQRGRFKEQIETLHILCIPHLHPDSAQNIIIVQEVKRMRNTRGRKEYEK